MDPKESPGNPSETSRILRILSNSPQTFLETSYKFFEASSTSAKVLRIWGPEVGNGLLKLFLKFEAQSLKKSCGQKSAQSGTSRENVFEFHLHEKLGHWGFETNF